MGNPETAAARFASERRNAPLVLDLLRLQPGRADRVERLLRRLVLPRRDTGGFLFLTVACEEEACCDCCNGQQTYTQGANRRLLGEGARNRGRTSASELHLVCHSGCGSQSKSGRELAPT